MTSALIATQKFRSRNDFTLIDMAALSASSVTFSSSHEATRSRSPPPSPHIPRQSLQTPAPTAGPSSSRNGSSEARPNLLEPDAGGDDCRIEIKALCTMCTPDKRQEVKYTCPRCSTKTCSVNCSRRHKETSGCSGKPWNVLLLLNQAKCISR